MDEPRREKSRRPAHILWGFAREVRPSGSPDGGRKSRCIQMQLFTPSNRKDASRLTKLATPPSPDKPPTTWSTVRGSGGIKKAAAWR